MNQEATKQADDDLYQRHQDDPRPNALYDQQGRRLPLDPCDHSQAGLRQEWVDLYADYGGKVKTTDKGPMCQNPPPPPKRPHEAVILCPLQTCVIKGLTIKCEDVGKGRTYFLSLPRPASRKTNLQDPDDVLEVIAGPDGRHGLELESKVAKPLCDAKHKHRHFKIDSDRESQPEVFKEGPKSSFSTTWSKDNSKWWKYLWPYSIKPVVYNISPQACAEAFSGLDAEVHVYPAVEVKATFKVAIDTGDEELKLEVSIGKLKQESPELINTAREIISLLTKSKVLIDDVTGVVGTLGPLSIKPYWPALGVSLTLSNEEDPDRYCVRTKYNLSLVAKPLIGIKIEGDVIDGVLKVLEAIGVSTVVAAPVAGLVELINWARRWLGAGLFIGCNGTINGTIGMTAPPWPEGQSKGEIGGEIVLDVQARAAKPGSTFITKFLSKARSGSTAGIELYITDSGADKRGMYLVSRSKFTGMFLYYGMAKSLKTETEYVHDAHGADNKSGFMILPEKEFWKDDKTYFYPPGGKE